MAKHEKLPVFEVIGEAFKYGWQKLVPLTVLYVAASVIVFVPIGALTYALFPNLIGELASIKNQVMQLDWTSIEDVEAFEESMGQFDPISNLFQVGNFILSGIFTAVVIRGITNGESLWLPKINMNFLRYLGASILTVLLFIPVVLLSFAIGAAGFGISEVLDVSEAGQAMITIPGVFLGIIAFIYCAMRLTLIPTDAVANSKIGISRGWKVSKGNAARLFGMYVVAVIFIFVVAMLMLIPFGLLAFYAFSDLATLTEGAINEDPTILFDYVLEIFKSPAGATLAVFGTLASVYMTAVMTSLPVIAYQRMKGAKSSASEKL